MLAFALIAMRFSGILGSRNYLAIYIIISHGQISPSQPALGTFMSFRECKHPTLSAGAEAGSGMFALSGSGTPRHTTPHSLRLRYGGGNLIQKKSSRCSHHLLSHSRPEITPDHFVGIYTETTVSGVGSNHLTIYLST